MKKYQLAVLGMLLAAGILTGCRGRMETVVPPTTGATTTPTGMTTAPTTAPTHPRETIEDGNGPIPGTVPSQTSKTGRR